jgi:hypothetical protein
MSDDDLFNLSHKAENCFISVGEHHNSVLQHELEKFPTRPMDLRAAKADQRVAEAYTRLSASLMDYLIGRMDGKQECKKSEEGN